MIIKNKKVRLNAIVFIVLGVVFVMIPVVTSAQVSGGSLLSAGPNAYLQTQLQEAEFGISKLILFVADIFDKLLGLVFILPPQVEGSWELMRNFVNMFFIFILIVVAFSTIFESDKYNWRKLLARFIIVAILINFSFAIGIYVVEIANNITRILLRLTGSSLSLILANGFSLSEISPYVDPALRFSANLLVNAVSGSTAQLIMTANELTRVILLLIILFSLLPATLFILVRIPFLWFLLIVSPIAWLGSTLPNLKNQTWDDWWKQFFGWNFFLPVYIFVLSFAVIFIKNKVAVLAYVQDPNLNQSFILNFGDFFFYIITIIFLVGGLGVAKKLSFLAGTQALDYFGKIQTGLKKTGVFALKHAPGSRYVQSVYGGAKEGLETKWEGMREKGVPGLIASERAARMRQAQIAEKLGGITARGLGDEQLVTEVNKLKKSYEKITNIAELRNMMNKGSKEQQLAAREVLKERGDLKAEQLLDTYKLYGGGQSLAALKFARGIDYGELSGGERDLLLTGVDDPEIKRKILKAKAEKGDFRSKPGQTPEQLAAMVEQWKTYAGIFQTDGDKKEFLNKIKKYALEASIRAQYDLGLIKKATNEPFASYQEAMQEEIRKMKLDDIIELSPNTLEGLVKPGADTRGIIKTKLTKEALAAIPGKVGASQLEILISSGLKSEKEEEIETEETKRLGKQAEAQAKGMKPLVDSINELVKTIKTKT